MRPHRRRAGAYKGTAVDVETDPAFYKRIAEAFPDAWLEDPDLDDEDAFRALAPHQDRITWDAPIHSVEDILARKVIPRTVNLKPSRFGSVKSLFAGYEFCEQRGMGAYGGGQYELGVGRGHVQLLAALFHPQRPERHRSGRLRRARSGARAARIAVGRRSRAPRLPPRHRLRGAMPPKPRQVRIESKNAQAAMQQLETRSDEELEKETRFKSAAQAILGTRAAERMDGPKARKHFQVAIAVRAPAGAHAAAADGRGVDRARRAPRR